MLDQRALKSPAGIPLALPSRLMALAVAAEWEQQVQRTGCSLEASDVVATDAATDGCS
jgi:chaperone required for assembly of F1-ATPase